MRCKPCRFGVQYSVVDVVIVTTVVAITMALWRPSRASVMEAKPYMVGIWLTDRGILMLLPDRYYYLGSVVPPSAEGVGWTMSRHGRIQGAFVVACGPQTYIVRRREGSGAVDVLNEDGSVRCQATELARWEGVTYDGAPHGTWRITAPSPMGRRLASMVYWHGELIDVRRSDGT